MDDRAAVLARAAAKAASAWFNAPHDVEAYRRLEAAVRARDAYIAPALTGVDETAADGELLDELPEVAEIAERASRGVHGVLHGGVRLRSVVGRRSRSSR